MTRTAFPVLRDANAYPGVIAELFREVSPEVSLSRVFQVLLPPDIRIEEAEALNRTLSHGLAKLIEIAPHLIRVAPRAIEYTEEACLGNVRGPIAWGATLAARINALNQPDLFVCRVGRATDNSAHLQALQFALLHARRDIASCRELQLVDPLIGATIDERAMKVRSLLTHRRLQFPARRPTQRELVRLTRERRSDLWRPVLAYLDHGNVALRPFQWARLADPKMISAIWYLITLMRATEERLPQPAVDFGGDHVRIGAFTVIKDNNDIQIESAPDLDECSTSSEYLSEAQNDSEFVDYRSVTSGLDHWSGSYSSSSSIAVEDAHGSG